MNAHCIAVFVRCNACVVFKDIHAKYGPVIAAQGAFVIALPILERFFNKLADTLSNPTTKISCVSTDPLIRAFANMMEGVEGAHPIDFLDMIVTLMLNVFTKLEAADSTLETFPAHVDKYLDSQLDNIQAMCVKCKHDGHEHTPAPYNFTLAKVEDTD